MSLSISEHLSPLISLGTWKHGILGVLDIKPNLTNIASDMPNHLETFIMGESKSLGGDFHNKADFIFTLKERRKRSWQKIVKLYTWKWLLGPNVSSTY